MRLSLRNRLALVFFAITLLAIGVLYLIVAPGLECRLIGEKLNQLLVLGADHVGPDPLDRRRRRPRDRGRGEGSACGACPATA